MIVSELKTGSLATGSPFDRPEGLHLSTIIKDICQSLDPKRYGQPMQTTKVGMGLKFEEVLEKAFQSAEPGAFRPAPILVPPGIWCSPDNVIPDPWAVSEFKLTWYSAKKQCPHDEVYWPWLVQIKGYCKALDTRLAKLWVLYVNGDYHPPQPWQPKVYGLEFSRTEIEENWSMLVNHAKSRGWLK